MTERSPDDTHTHTCKFSLLLLNEWGHVHHLIFFLFIPLLLLLIFINNVYNVMHTQVVYHGTLCEWFPEKRLYFWCQSTLVWGLSLPTPPSFRTVVNEAAGGVKSFSVHTSLRLNYLHAKFQKHVLPEGKRRMHSLVFFFFLGLQRSRAGVCAPWMMVTDTLMLKRWCSVPARVWCCWLKAKVTRLNHPRSRTDSRRCAF